ncbi:hypothetical protein TNCV_3817601 [Trichonephila clavipes]|nr:hypothetical protein TNCV_3817601 [Trichonephila clavipes]
MVVVAADATCLTQSDQGPRNSSWQGAISKPVVGRRLEHHTGDSTIQLGFTPIFRRNTLGSIMASHLSSTSTNLTRGLAARWLFRVPPATKALYIC